MRGKPVRTNATAEETKIKYKSVQTHMMRLGDCDLVWMLVVFFGLLRRHRLEGDLHHVC